MSALQLENKDKFEPMQPKPGVRGFLQDLSSGLPTTLVFASGWTLILILSGKSMFPQILIVPVAIMCAELAITFLKRWTQAQDKRLPEELIVKVKALNNPDAVYFENPFSHIYRTRGTGFSIRSTSIQHLTTDHLYTHIVRSTGRTKYLKRDMIAGILICIPIICSVMCYSWLKTVFIDTPTRLLLFTSFTLTCYLIAITITKINDSQIDEKMIKSGVISKKNLINLLSQIKKHPNALKLGNPITIRMASQFRIDKLMTLKHGGD